MKTDQIMEYVCDNLCKYPAEYKDPDDLWNEQCDHCKLMELLGEEKNTIKSYERTIRKLVDAIEELSAKVDSLQIFMDNISKLPDCNTCMKKTMCEFLPKYGDYCRINCPLWLPEPPDHIGSFTDMVEKESEG